MADPLIRKWRNLPKRYRFKNDGYSLNERKIGAMIALVYRSGVVEVLEAVMSRRSDAEARTSIRLVIVASLVNAMRKDHKGQVSALTAVITNFAPKIKRWMGSPQWTEPGGYDRVQRLLTQIAATLDEGPLYTDPKTGKAFRVGHKWYTHSLLYASIPMGLIENSGIAVDGTVVESSGLLHTDPLSIYLDGDFRQDDPKVQEHQEEAKRRNNKRKAKVLGIGADGRNIYTKDFDARAGYRTATNGEPASLFIGRELHIGIAVQRIAFTDRVHSLTFGPEVPNVILFADLTPAGTHRGDTVLPYLLDLHARGLIGEVIADPGYTLAAKNRFHLPLKKAGIDLTLRPVTHQLKPRLLNEGVVLDGQLFSAYTPENLRNLVAPPRSATHEERKPYIEKFEQRSLYRYSRHANIGGGATRYADPFRSHKLRSEQLAHTMRNNRTIPRVTLPDGFDPDLVDCTTTIGADELPLEQPTIFGTTAWNLAWGRRNLVETANGLLKGGNGAHADIRRGYTLHLNTGRIRFHLAATLAIHNYNVMENWNRHPDTPKERKKRSDSATRWIDLPEVTGIRAPGADPPH